MNNVAQAALRISNAMRNSLGTRARLSEKDVREALGFETFPFCLYEELQRALEGLGYLFAQRTDSGGFVIIETASLSGAKVLHLTKE